MSGRRVDVRGAAEALGISAEAVRKRVARGTLEHEKDDEGHVWVILDGREDGDRTEYGHREDGRADVVLVEVLREEIAHLRRESERKDAIIMQMAQANGELSRTVRALEAPHHNGHEAHQEDVQEEAQEPPHGAGGAQPGSRELEETAKRPWWIRIFGG